LLIKRSHIQRLLQRDEDNPFGWNELVNLGLIEYVDTEVRGLHACPPGVHPEQQHQHLPGKGL
jgi:hypothetical protein